MMTQEYFAAMKADLLKTYAADLCEESVADIQAATSLRQFIDVLNKYTAFLKYKSIPEIGWVRKWFSYHKSEAEECGCYLDCYRIVIDPKQPITLYGTANVTLFVTEPHIYQVTTQDDSSLQVDANGVAAVNIRQKHNSKVFVLNKNKQATIKIRKV